MADQKKVEEAVRTLIEWTGDHKDREGLLDTPKRVTDAYKEFFSGYSKDAKALLEEGYSEVEGYQNIILVQKIPFYSHCEHHMIPFFGHVDIAYLPQDRVVGFSRLVRVLEIFSRRLQIQEKLTQQVAQTIFEALAPKGVAVLIQAEHLCMSMRGIRKTGVKVKTQSFLGSFSTHIEQEKLFRMLD